MLRLEPHRCACAFCTSTFRERVHVARTTCSQRCQFSGCSGSLADNPVTCLPGQRFGVRTTILSQMPPRRVSPPTRYPVKGHPQPPAPPGRPRLRPPTISLGGRRTFDAATAPSAVSCSDAVQGAHLPTLLRNHWLHGRAREGGERPIDTGFSSLQTSCSPVGGWGIRIPTPWLWTTAVLYMRQ